MDYLQLLSKSIRDYITPTNIILLIVGIAIGTFITEHPNHINLLLFVLIIILIFSFSNTKESFELPMDRPPTYKYPLQQNSKSDIKMSVKPIIVPKLADREVWSFPSYRHSAVNYNNMRYDLSEEYAPIQGFLQDPLEYDPYDPRVSKYTKFDLDKLGNVCPNYAKNLPPPYPLYPSDMDGTPAPSFDPRSGSTPINQVAPSQAPSQAQAPAQERYRGAQRSQERYHGARERYDNTPSQAPSPSQSQAPASITPIGVVAPTSQFFDPGQIYPLTAGRPSADLLIPRTIPSIYGPGQVTAEERVKYFENVQPNEYSWSDVAEPINANMGISYNPDLPPLVLDQVADPYGKVEPIFHRIDPQLIRDQNIPMERLEEMPRRTSWSARYGGFDATPGTVNFEDIYDPRFNGYGDEYRSYGDVNLGQIQYYYSDLDAYRNPNFSGSRNKVDFIDFVDPMGRILPEYDRQVGSADIREAVHNQYDADAVYHREDIMEKLLRKRNQELWQLRAAPIYKGSHVSSFTSNYM